MKRNTPQMLHVLLSSMAILLLVACSTTSTSQHHDGLRNGFQLIEASIQSTKAALKQKTVSCVDLVQAYLDRIKKYDQPSKLNAIIYVNPKALQKAKELDTYFNQHGQLLPLHCVTVILKDNFDTADMPTEAGSIALRGSHPPDDAFMVRKLREAGAIILAKSNMGEWAFSPYNTLSSTHGETRNAYDLSRVPAGSSGGTASAVAANFGLVGMGTDTGNSIRGPASHLALVGMRSTLGVTSRDGVVPLLENRDIAGPLTRSVADNATIFTVIAGYDPADPITLAMKAKTPINYQDSLNEANIKGLRIGVLRQVYESNTLDFGIQDLMTQAIEDLRAAGAEIVDPIHIENLEALMEATGFCSRFRYDLKHYLDSLGPSSPIDSLDTVVKSKQYLEVNQGAMDWAMSVGQKPEEQDPPCVGVDGDPRRKNLLHAVLTSMDTNKLDAFIYPSWSNPPRKIGDSESPHGNNSPKIAPHTGQPAITVPMGFVANLPAGLQILGRPFSEELLYRIAYVYEQSTKHRKPPALFP